MAATNKCLARISKTAAGVRATKGHQPEGDVGEARNKHLLPPPQSEEAEFDPALLTKRPYPQPSQPEDRAFSSSVMTSADSLSLILRRLDEIERKLDRMMEELRPPSHRLFGTPGQSSKKGLMTTRGAHRRRS